MVQATFSNDALIGSCNIRDHYCEKWLDLLTEAVTNSKKITSKFPKPNSQKIQSIVYYRETDHKTNCGNIDSWRTLPVESLRLLR